MTSTVGFVSDHRLPLKPTEIESFLRRLATELGVVGVPAAGPLPESALAWIKPVAADLKRTGGKCVVLVGEHLPPSAHAIGHAVNHKLGTVGKTVNFTDPVQLGLTGPDADNHADGAAAIKTLADEMRAGKVEALLLLGNVNPAYSAPADVDFVGALNAMVEKKQPRFRLGLYEDETSLYCDWHINEAHQLESWGDARAYDGTASLQQPLIASIVEGKSILEVLTVLLARPNNDNRESVKATWLKHFTDKKISGEFDDYWHNLLEQGVVPDTAFATITVGEPKTHGDSATAAAGHRRGRNRTRLQARSDDLRWPLRQQRLAAGTAQADDLPYVGQRPHHEPGHGEPSPVRYDFQLVWR